MRNQTFPIPPKSELELVKLWPHAREYGHKVGEHWRVGYYSRQDGLEVIWLVNDAGEYVWTIDRAFLAKKFRITRLSEETDYFGEERARLPRRKFKRRKSTPQS